MELYTRDFTYNLPEERIALFPSANRDESRLLYYNRGNISHHIFRDVVGLIPKGALLIFNNSKVIPARLKFKNQTGATIEIFLLHPTDKDISAHELIQSGSPVRWTCTIGNKKKWQPGLVLTQTRNGIELRARILNEAQNVIEFTFSGCSSWAEVIKNFGDTPLPPYIKRATELSDNERYQTVYSSVQGAVAAPTAGLHFTSEILKRLQERNIQTDYLTLHVSAGTFMPIKSEKATSHIMHEESIYFSKANIESLISGCDNIIAIGTTSCRSLESLYWFGVKLMEEDSPAVFEIDQNFAYHKRKTLPSRRESLERIHHYMEANNLHDLHGQTSIYVYPGYSFKMTDGLITNFHQPNSTLLLLIAAFIGPDWKKIYESAMENDYRFLSYGDSSLLLPIKKL